MKGNWGRLTLNSTSLLRGAAAAGLYLLLMWGYTELPSPQWFAVYLALIMSCALLYWVGEAAAAASCQREEVIDSSAEESMHVAVGESDAASLEASIVRLDSLKSELTLQYAQFGQDQSLINSNGLGSWHGNRKPQAR